MSAIFSQAALALTLVVGSIFVLAAVAKFIAFHSFIGAVAQFQLLPFRFVRPAAWAIAATELLTGAFLLIGKLIPESALVAAALFGLFALAVAINLRRGRDQVSCGCFGAAGSRISWWLVARNASLSVLMFLLGYIYADFAQPPPIDRISTSLIVFGSITLVCLGRALVYMSYQMRGGREIGSQ